jgi:hypothetical protein
MKKLLFSLIITLSSLTSQADQYQIVSEDYAITAVELLNYQSDVIAWCDCCGDSDYMKYIQVESAYYEYAGGESNDCYVFLSGYDEYGQPFEESIDLAYVFIADGELAVRVSDYIGLPSEQCTEYFSYYDAYPFLGDYEVEEEYYEYEEGSDEYDYESEDGYADAPYITETVFAYLSSIDCGDYCYLNFDSPDNGFLSAIVVDPSEFPDYFYDSEYGYYLNPSLEGLAAYVTYEIIDVDYEDGTYGSENLFIGLEFGD